MVPTLYHGASLRHVLDATYLVDMRERVSGAISAIKRLSDRCVRVQRESVTEVGVCGGRV